MANIIALAEVFINLVRRCTEDRLGFYDIYIFFLFLQDHFERIKKQDEKSLWPVRPEWNHFSSAFPLGVHLAPGNGNVSERRQHWAKYKNAEPSTFANLKNVWQGDN
jgi:hypothetical protein